MAANRVESSRAVFSWSQAQQEEGAEFDFSESDRVVANATEHGVELLPIVTETPLWARARVRNWWPQRASDFTAYVRALVERYGPAGSFWEERGDGRRGLAPWQIFDEPGRSKRYAPLLEAAHRAVKKADPRAKIVLAGLTGTEEGAPWDILRYQYRQGSALVRHRGAPPVHGQGGERGRGRAPVQEGDDAAGATATSRCG